MEDGMGDKRGWVPPLRPAPAKKNGEQAFPHYPSAGSAPSMGAETIKGPWRRVGHRQIMDADGAVVCEVWSSVGIQEADANEELIAAAPDMLKTLRLVLAEALGPAPHSDFSFLPPAVVDQLRAVIIKATGAA
jgi:hypothetical protein